MRQKTLILLSTLLLFACSQEPAAPANTADQAATMDPIAAAIANPDRPDTDRDADQRRKPAEILAFFAIKPGMTVLDMYSGGGYYTQLLSGVVGDQGKVYAHNNTPYLNWLSEPIKARYQSGKMTNVERFTAENNQLDLPANTFDAVLMSLSYHDVYHVDPDNGWEKIDGPAMLAQLFQSMKPGSVLAVIDHAAAAGAPPETGETLHRIDPQLALEEITAAGFVFEASSDILANPEDDHTLHTFSEEMRGKTDRFVFRFRRP
ncbi:MAG: class I SAM-dependent methyltransferase [Gammaproteobacteria bacterium]|jgi:predicted methyltransferase|nr:class I SAM-dependent methyltransferase [Gammaproteobacteria bacterium]